MNTPPKIGVLGIGAWGTALCVHLAKLHTEIQFWGRDKNHLEQILAKRENQRYLPGVSIPDSITACAQLSTVVETSSHLLVAIPSVAMREVMQQINQHTAKKLRGIIWACKGLEHGSGKFLHQVAREELAPEIKHSILSGPSFAKEVGMGLPTAVTIASSSIGFARESAQLFHHPLFRAYTSTDVAGVEIGGTFKNVLAIAAGILDSLQFGANARAALITRGVAEMVRLGKHLQVDTDTFTGLSGIGDIILTCTGDMSRNRRFGLGLGLEKPSAEIESEIGQVIEGKYAAKVIYDLSKKLAIDLPINKQVYEVIYNEKSPRKAVEALLSRSIKHEAD